MEKKSIWKWERNSRIITEIEESQREKKAVCKTARRAHSQKISENRRTSLMDVPKELIWL